MNRVLRKANDYVAKGVQPADAWEIARKDVYGDDIFGDAAAQPTGPKPSGPPSGGGATVESFWNRVPAQDLNRMSEADRLFRERNGRQATVAELEAMLAGKNPAPDVPLTQPRQAQAPSAKPVDNPFVPSKPAEPVAPVAPDVEEAPRLNPDDFKRQEEGWLTPSSAPDPNTVREFAEILSEENQVPEILKFRGVDSAEWTTWSKAERQQVLERAFAQQKNTSDFSLSDRWETSDVVKPLPEPGAKGEYSFVAPDPNAPAPVDLSKVLERALAEGLTSADATRVGTPLMDNHLIRALNKPEYQVSKNPRPFKSIGDIKGREREVMGILDKRKEAKAAEAEAKRAANAARMDTTMTARRKALDDAIKMPRHEYPAQLSDNVRDAATEFKFQLVNGEKGDRISRYDEIDGRVFQAVGSSNAPFYKELFAKYTDAKGKSLISKDAILSALNKIIKDKGSDKGVNVERVKEIILQQLADGLETTAGRATPDWEARMMLGYSRDKIDEAYNLWEAANKTDEVVEEVAQAAPKAGQEQMFKQGEDSPLFSGTPMTAKESPFIPEEQAGTQGKMFSTAPEFGAGKKKPKGFNASDAQVRGMDPNEMHSAGEYRQRFNAAVDEMKQAGPEAVTNGTLNKKVLDALEQVVVDRIGAKFSEDAVKAANVMPPEVANEANRYLKQDYTPGLNQAKQGAGAAGRLFQESTVLNYDGKWNIEDAMLLERPFVHWWLHSALNYARDFLDHPAALAFALRLTENLHAESNRLVAEGKLPKRYADSVKLTLPVSIPGLGDTLWFNPMRTLFPYEDVLQMTAVERASYQSVKEDGTTDPASVLSDVFGMHLPYQLAFAAVSDDEEDFNTKLAGIPAMRYFRGLTGQGIDSEYDKFYYEKALKELVADGELTPEQASVALLQQSGPDWEKVRARANLENYQIPLLTGLTGFKGKPFSKGEAKFMEGQRTRDQMKLEAARKAGRNPNMDYDAMEAFLEESKFYDSPEWKAFQEKYPELETGSFINKAYGDEGTRMPESEAQQARYLSYITSAIWDKYRKAPELKQKLIAADLGDDFKNLFLDKPEQGKRDYTKIPLSMLLGWANAVDVALLDVAKMQEPIPDPYQVTFTTDAQNKAYQTMYDEVAKSYGWTEYNAAWDKYYALKEQNKDAAKAFLDSPEGKKLGVTRDYIAKFYNDNSDIRGILEKAGLKKTQAETTSTTSDPRGTALNQAVTAAGLNWDKIKAHDVVYDKLPKGTGARSNYLAEHPDYARYKNLARAIYGDDGSQSDYNGGGSKSDEPYFKYYPKDTYSRTYGQPRGGGKLEIDFAMLKEANERFRPQQKEPYQRNTTYRVGSGTY
jgi:hypothetical protein